MAPPALSAAAALRRSKQHQPAAQQQQSSGKSRQGLPPPPHAQKKTPALPPSLGPSRLANHSPEMRPSSRNETETESGSMSEEDEEEEEEELALQMDGQDLWNQNYCSVCDCRIEPGAGVGPIGTGISAKPKPSPVVEDERPILLTGPQLVRKNSSAASSTSSGLQSNASTIKTRPSSTEGRLKRNGSSGKLATTPIRRNGSAGSRLNPLSDLKPTTKLNGDIAKPAKAGSGAAGSGAAGKISPKASRRNSAASLASVATAASEAESLHSQPSPRSTLPRSKKGGLLGGMTPAALKQKQQEEEEASRATAFTALYCSETCREIDQQSSVAGLEQFGFYANQQFPPISPTWDPHSLDNSRAVRPSSISSLRGTGAPTKSSDSVDGQTYTCNECHEKNSASGTVPSGASDTTEGSGGYTYGRSGVSTYRKQRSQSGRIITPQNLLPPSGEDDYFPRYTDSRQHLSVSSINTGNNVATVPEGQRPPERTASAASGDTGRSGTGSSAQSTRSYAEFWEPKLKSTETRKAKASDYDSYVAGATAIDDLVSSQAGRTRAFTTSQQSQGTTQGTAPPPFAPPSSVPASGSILSGASPLRLMGMQNNTVSGSPSVDVSADLAHIPALPRTRLGESFASEQTLGTSAKTLIHREPSLRERRQVKGKSLKLEFPEGGSNKGSAEGVKSKPDVNVNSAECLSNSCSGSNIDALNALKVAAGECGPASSSSSRPSPNMQAGIDDVDHASSPRRNSTGAGLLSSASSGFLKGISSAWTAFRGAPQSSISTPTLIVPDDASGSRRDSRRVSASQLYSTSSRAVFDSSPGSGRGRSSVRSDNSNNCGQLSKSAASESLSKIMSSTHLNKSYSGGSSASVTRPGASRGSVPAFAKEIGQGQIPGEAAATLDTSSSPPVAQDSASSPVPRRNSSSLCFTTIGGTEAERRRRKAEQRHQRSKDITMLPPLLAPSNRPGSAANVAQHRSRSRSRSTAPSGHGATFTVGSLGSIQDANYPSTPSLMTARTRDGARSPEISLNDGTPIVRAEEDLNPLPRASSHQDLYRAGTSPRRSGLGWGAMTPITSYAAHPPSLPQHQHQPQPLRQGNRLVHHTSGPPVSRGGLVLGNIGLLGHHPQGSQSTYGRHHTVPVRTTTPIVPEDGGEMSGAALTGQDVECFHREAAATAATGPHSRPHSAMSNRRGSYAAAQHGGAATSAATGAGGAGGSSRPRNWMTHRNSYGGAGLVPPSPKRNQIEPLPERTWSYDNLVTVGSSTIGGAGAAGGKGISGGLAGSGATGAGGASGVRTYSILTVPGREETHDRYDETWNHVVEMLAGKTGAGGASTKHAKESSSSTSGAPASTQRESAQHRPHHPADGERAEGGGGALGVSGNASAPPVKRKQLFHFGP